MTAAADHAWLSYVHSLSCGEVPSVAQLAALSSTSRLDVLASLAYDQFEAKLRSELIQPFWQAVQSAQATGSSKQHGLLQPLQDLAQAVSQQAQQLSALAQQLLHALLQQQHDGAATLAQQEQQQQRGQLYHDVAAASTVALLASLCDGHRMAVTSLLMATAPCSLPGVLQQYYTTKLHELCDVMEQLHEQQQQDDSDAMSEDSLTSPTEQQQQQQARPGGEPDPLPVLGAAWCAELAGVCGALQQLGLGAAAEEAHTRIINSYVLERLAGLSTHEFEEAVLPRAQRLVCAGPLAFLRLVLSNTPQPALKLQEWQLRLTYLLLETLGALRSADMFDIVIDYPDSAPALQDLAVCLQHTSLAGHFAATFKAALQQRLLHAGAATADIITTYVSTIRAMQQVDKSGLLLELVSEPIRVYLRSRPDTIRCIVSMLTEDPSDPTAAAGPGGSLLEELQQQQQQQHSSHHTGPPAAAAGAGGGGFAAGGVSSSTAAAAAAAHASYNWCIGETEGDEAALRLLEALESGTPAVAGEAEAAGGGASGGEERPEQQQQQSTLLGLPLRPPAAASAALSGGGRGDGDVVSMLIGIYGGPLLFMEEYKRMLADRLLAKEEYDCVREIRTLELLKIRFGDAGLHACEVLLKDMADSKRLDANIRALQPVSGGDVLPPGVDSVLSRCRATVCSYLFWPDLPEHDMKLPPELHTALEVYAERFRHLKTPRKLHWRPTLGLVTLAVTVGDSQPLDFTVTPVHAALLLQFASDGSNAGSSGSSDAVGEAAAAGVEGSSSGLQQQQQAGCVWRTAAQLSSAMGVPVGVVRRKAMFWVAAGVLLERRGAKGEVVYTRATRIDPSRIVSRETTDFSWQESSGPSASAEDRLTAEMGPFENYIIGMLTNFGALPVDRLHNMLRVFVVGEPRYEGRSQEQLGAFLQLMVGQGKLEVNNGIYSKHKGGAVGA